VPDWFIEQERQALEKRDPAKHNRDA